MSHQIHTAVSRFGALQQQPGQAGSVKWSSTLTCLCSTSSILVDKKQAKVRRQRHQTHSASPKLLAGAARAPRRLSRRVSALGFNGDLDCFTHHPEAEEVEESWALESGDSHGRLPLGASGRRDVDLGQNHSTETQPSPHTQILDSECMLRACSESLPERPSFSGRFNWLTDIRTSSKTFSDQPGAFFSSLFRFSWRGNRDVSWCHSRLGLHIVFELRAFYCLK